MKPEIVKRKDLQLGDVVSLFPEQPFSTCIVKQIKDGYITLFRPYGVSADFSYTGGVLTYTGIEEFDIEDASLIALYERKNLK